MLRFAFSAFLALAAFGTSVECRAQDYPGYHRKVHRLYSHAPRHRGHIYSQSEPSGWVWGGLFGSRTLPFPWYDSGLNNYPGYYNNHSFWERVQTQGNYPIQY
jgi:hypothetical protein